MKDAPAGSASASLSDVRGACEKRSTWTRRFRDECTTCMSLAAAPACGCPADRKDYSGRCSKEQAAKLKDETCKGLMKCERKCGRDCDCLAKCYEGQHGCYDIASKLDGCLIEVCDAFCK